MKTFPCQVVLPSSSFRMSMPAEMPGRDGERQSLGFTLAVLKEIEGKDGICAFFKDLIAQLGLKAE